MTAGLALWRGDPGADLESGPLAEELAARADRVALALARVGAEAALLRGEAREAEAFARRLVSAAPHDDSAQVLLMHALDGLGRPTEALAAFADYRESVRDAFGTSPSTEAQALHLEILSRDPGLAPRPSDPLTETPAHPSAADPPSVDETVGAGSVAGIPARDSVSAAPLASAIMRPPVSRGVRSAPNALIGRDRALLEIEELMRHARVTTVLGPGGLGKTRIAHEIAARAVARSTPTAVGANHDDDDGAASAVDDLRFGAVIVAELAGVRSADDVIFGLASAVGIREAATSTRIGEPVPRADLRERLLHRLGETPTLLVVDNCEHVIDAAAEWIAALTAELPGLTVLTTSRTPLAISSERVYPLAPLGARRAIPPPGALTAPPIHGGTAAETADDHDDDAVRLFLDRATAARPDAIFPLDAVRRLCERLDGLPLAIELAAARIRSLSIDEIERRLSNRFALLTGGDRSAPERHRTLLAVIEWSWNLLGRAEQRALAELSEFADGFGLDGAASLLGADGSGPADEIRVAEVLDGLIAQSLVTVHETATGARYRMLETVREFGQRELDAAGRRDEVRDALFGWADDFARRSRPRMDGPHQVETFRQVRDDEENLIDVLRRAIEAERPEIVCSVFALLGYCWTLRSAHGEVLGFGRTVFESVRNYDPAPDRVDGLAEALTIIAATTLLSDLRFGVRPLSRLRRLVRTRPLRDPRLAAMAGLLLAAGRDETMRAAIREARASADRPTAMLGALIGSVLAENDGAREHAVAEAKHAAQLARELDDVWGESMAAQMLAALYAQAAEPVQALRWAQVARGGLEQLGALGDLQQLDWVEANSTLASGDVAAAERMYERLLELPGETDGVDFRSIALAGQAEVLRAAGRPEEARDRFEEAVRSFGAPVGRASPWFRILLSGMLSALVLDGAGTASERLALARRLRARVLAGLRGGRYVDRPVLGSSIVGLAVWLDAVTPDHIADGPGAGEPGADEPGTGIATEVRPALELLALAEAMHARQDSPALQLDPILARFATHTDPARIAAARESARALPRDEGPERIAALLRAPGPWSSATVR